MSWTTVSSGGSSVWTKNDTTAYYNTGNVAIGTTVANYTLNVAGNMNLTSGLRVNNSYGESGQVLTSGGGGVMSWTSSPQFTQINLGSTTITQSEPGVIQFGGETVRTGDVSLGTETSGNYVAAITGSNGISSTSQTSVGGTTHTLLSVNIKVDGGLVIPNGSQKLEVDLGAKAMTGILSNTSGGTGFTTYSQGDLLVGTSPSGLKKLQKGTAGYVLTVNGSGSDIEWQAPAGENININGNFVGISNVSPTHTLHIGSNVIVSDTGMDVLRVNGNVYTTNYFIGDGSKMSGITSIKNEFGGNKFTVGDGNSGQQTRNERYEERYAQIP